MWNKNLEHQAERAGWAASRLALSIQYISPVRASRPAMTPGWSICRSRWSAGDDLLLHQEGDTSTARALRRIYTHPEG
jgi:hypothetical protein